jgi:hypothetical protein
MFISALVFALEILIMLEIVTGLSDKFLQVQKSGDSEVGAKMG